MKKLLKYNATKYKYLQSINGFFINLCQSQIFSWALTEIELPVLYHTCNKLVTLWAKLYQQKTTSLITSRAYRYTLPLQVLRVKALIDNPDFHRVAEDEVVGNIRGWGGGNPVSEFCDVSDNKYNHSPLLHCMFCKLTNFFENKAFHIVIK